MIEGVAIKVGELMVCMPRPNRHHHCIHYAVTELMQKPPITGEQGFYTDDGKFLNRVEAASYARKIGQPLKREKLHVIGELNVEYLFSEDLW